jgi:HlyD family secretion protein
MNTQENTTSKNKKTELLRSPSASELINRKPSFIIQWGLVFFVFFFFILISVCWFIQYPDIVTAKAKLNSVNAPKEIITHTDGKLIKIKVKENDTVQAGQVLAYMESLANPTAIQQVNSQIDTIQKLISNNQTNEVINFFPNYSNQALLNQLGEVQASYQTFIQSFITFKDFLNNGFYLRKKTMLLIDLQNIQKLNAILISQKELLQKDLSLTNETFKANESLAKDKVISSMDYRNEESKLIAKKLSLPQINSSIVSNESQQNEKRKEIAELENQISVQKNTFIQALQTIKNQLQAWEFKYLLKASIAGTVSFTGFFQENQEIKNEQPLFYVQPSNTAYFVEMLIPQYNFGKIKQGQQVLLKFQAYPYEQFGAVVGKIEYINSIPSDSGYLSKVTLPDGLVTNYKKQLQYRNGLFAQADIITENTRLLERFYYNLVKQVKR